MSLFGKPSGLPRGPFGGDLFDIFDNEPNILEKVDMLFTDAETEGKKMGYKRAADEYEKVFREIEAEYSETKELFEQQKNKYDSKSEELINKLEDLERKKEKLEKEVKSKSKELSRQYDIPLDSISKSLATGSIIMDPPNIGGGVLDIIYKYKSRKLKEAEQEGYIEAKALYKEKISKLKAELRRLKDKGNKEIKDMLDMIDELFEAIADEQVKIAELKMLL